MEGTFPETDPSGALNPPNRRPPTAVGLATPLSPQPMRRPLPGGSAGLVERLRRVTLVFLDVADEIADTVTRGLRKL
jgi:hypothetical protein